MRELQRLNRRELSQQIAVMSVHRLCFCQSTRYKKANADFSHSERSYSWYVVICSCEVTTIQRADPQKLSDATCEAQAGLYLNLGQPRIPVPHSWRPGSGLRRLQRPCSTLFGPLVRVDVSHGSATG